MMFLSPDVKILATENRGRGVFATEPITAHTIIEIAPVIVMTKSEQEFLDKTLLHDYIFLWDNGNNCCCVALGWVSIYNHSYNSNCVYEMDYETNAIAIITVRDIAKGEELMINYNGSWNDEAKVWFDVN